MKRASFCLVVLAVLSACNNTADIHQKADSLVNEADSLGEKIWDSGKQKMINLKEKVKIEFNKDSANK